jgi:ABC-type multidrug transport system fused ATPase/permease subunit
MDLKERLAQYLHWEEFRQSNKDVWEVYLWISREINSDLIRYWTKRMFWIMVISCLVKIIGQSPVGLMFDGLHRHAVDLIIYGLLALGGLHAVQHFTGDHYTSARERLQGFQLAKLEHEITRMLFEKSIGQHRQESSSLSVKNIDKGRGRIMQIQETILFSALTVMLELVISLVFAILISPTVGAILLAIFVGHILWAMRVNHKIKVTCGPFEDDFRALNRHRLSRWEKIDRVKTSAKTAEELDYMSNEFDRILKDECNFWCWFIRRCTVRNCLTSLVYLGALVWGIRLAWTDQLMFVWFVTLYNCSNKVMDNLWQISTLDNQIKKNLPSVQAMIRALSTEVDVVIKEDATYLDESDDLTVEFENVSYVYPPSLGDASSSPAVLRDFSLTIEPGEKVALIGPSGAGKTTVMHLLLRHMDPTDGTVKIGSYDLRDLDLNSWLLQTGYIPQGNQVFDGTIRYNLTYSLPPSERSRYTDERLWNLMQDLEIDFGNRLTRGLDTLVGDNGVKLSGGQAQRLMIGAAVIGNPRFMIIDEATSSLDSTTERKVQAGLQKILTPAVSALIIAHRLSTVQDLCSRFVVLRPLDTLGPEESQVEAVASSFEELYDLSPTFRELAIDQKLSIALREPAF